MTASISPSHDTKDLTFTLGTSPNRKGDILKIYQDHHANNIAFITDLSGSEDEGIDVGQKCSAHITETKIEIGIEQQENASETKLHHFQLEHTLELSRSLTSLTYFRSSCNLISAGTGMVTIFGIIIQSLESNK